MYMTQALHRAAKLYPNVPALISEKRNFTWSQMIDRVARLAGALRKLGLQTENRVAMLSLNSDRYAEYYYATFWAGANVVPVNIRWSIPEHVYSITDTTSLTRLIYGASPITQAILKEAMASMPATRFIHAYGETELAPLVTLLGSDYHVLEGPKSEKIRSVGQPVVSVEVEIVDESDNEVSRGTVGEVRVRGANTIHGYWRKPEQTATTLRDGWVYTGDGGYMDEDGFVYIVDRVKDMVITGGENVFSAEVENAIMQFPGLAECAVIGIPDEKWGEAVHAIVVPREGESPDPDAIMEHCRGLIAGYKCPRSVDIRPEALPKSGAGKIQKFELRAPFWGGRDRHVS